MNAYVMPTIVFVMLGVVAVIAWITVMSKMSRTFAQPEESTIAISPESAKNKLAQYYIKASYNSCASGDYQNDYVSLAALSNVIANGCRFLDFEVYDLDEIPTVAVSSSNSYMVIGTFNSIPLVDVLKRVKKEAFAVSNSRDPLFLQFRMKTEHVNISGTCWSTTGTISGTREKILPRFR